MKRSLFLLGLFIPLVMSAQTKKCLSVPMQKVKVTLADNVLHKGVFIEKGQSLSLPLEIPLNINKSFFYCYNLHFEKDGELQFYDGNKKSVRRLGYDDFMGNSRTYASERSSNTVSRGDYEPNSSYCNKSDVLNSDFHVLNLVNQKVHIYDYECLQVYFDYPVYYQIEDDILIFNEDDFYIKGLLFQTSDGNEYRFLKEGNEIKIDSKVLPEEDVVSLFLIEIDGVSSLMTKFNYVNLHKIISRIKNENRRSKKIENIVNQLYLSSIYHEIKGEEIKNRLEEKVKNYVSK